MKFSLNAKIEEIRQKPEHIRIRYVWGAVALSMFFIIVMWGFSVKENFQSVGSDSGRLSDIKEEVRGLGENIPNIGGIKNSLEESMANPDETEEGAAKREE